MTKDIYILTNEEIFEIQKKFKKNWHQEFRLHYTKFFNWIEKTYRLKFSEGLYVHLYGRVKCPECGSLTQFKKFSKGYHIFCSNSCAQKSKDVQRKIKKTNFKQYGDENYRNCNKIKETKLEKYGDMKYNNKEQTKKTNQERYGGNAPQCSLEIRDKTKQTNLDTYGYESVFQVPVFKEKQKQTMLERYGVEYPLLNYRMKDYITPSGKIRKLQGYEPQSFDKLLEFYDEDDIFSDVKDMPKLWYIGEDVKKHRYYPDFYIPKDNLIVEVKSTWTMKTQYKTNLLKEQSTKKAGYNFYFHIL